jgi:hypothetical protein
MSGDCEFSLDALIGSAENIVNSADGGKEKASKVESQASKNGFKIDLNNYAEIPKSEWNTMPLGTYVRFEDKTGKISTGGKIKKLNSEKEGSPSITLCKWYPNKKKFYIWNTKWSDIKKIYKYKIQNKDKATKNTDYEVVSNIDTMSDMGDSMTSKPPETKEEQLLGVLGNKLLFEDTDVEHIKRKVDALESDVHKIGEDIVKIFAIVKKLHSRVLNLEK